MNLAWFSPWPPQPSGIAGRSAELVAALAARGHGVDVFVDDRARRLTRVPDEGPSSGAVRVQSAHDFVWRAARGQYQRVVYQMGNSRLHEFMWPYLFQFPGITVLHDARLHHARGRSLLLRDRDDDYRAEFSWNHPGVPADLAELGVRGFDGPYYYQWPMVRAIVESSTLTLCHSRGAAAELRDAYPQRAIDYLPLGEGPADPGLSDVAGRFRSRHGLDPSHVIFGVHGALTREKRVLPILRAFAALRTRLNDCRLLLAGRPDPALELDRHLDELGCRDAVHLISDLDDAEFDAAIAASDVCLNLRWPTALETSGPWIRSLALSRATVILDLAHQGHVPVLDPRTWRRHAPCEDLGDGAEARAVAVAIDVLDEDHSLRIAMRELAGNPPLRQQLGRAARAYWEREHTVDRMVTEFERLATQAQPAGPRPGLPPHLRPDPMAWARTLVTPLGIDLDRKTPNP